MKKTKIVCTIGPACDKPGVLEKMLKSGMNVARLNFSHGTHEAHKKYIETFREVRDRLGIPAAVMLDTKGPEIRIGMVEGDKVTIVEGEEFVLKTKPMTANKNAASISYAALPSQLKKGDRILIDDGKLSLRVESTTGDEIRCTITQGGILQNRKSINCPGIALKMDFLSEADKSDLLFGIENDVDFISASFVRTADDIVQMRKFLDYNNGHNIKIIAKIENSQGIENFDEILAIADGIMVARGDMGVEIDFDRLPGIQKRFIKRCYQSGKMVITATQMLESMVTNQMPTRAEITDVANAVFDGTSAVMLSGESAMGHDPANAVAVMNKIVLTAEHDAFVQNAYKNIGHDLDSADIANAICDAGCITARDLKAKAIIAVTMKGHTARRMSKFRPEEPIIAATPNRKTYHQLSLSWGVYPVISRYITDSDELFIHAIDCAKQLDMVEDGDTVVITAGLPLDIGATTNMLRVHVIGEPVSHSKEDAAL